MKQTAVEWLVEQLFELRNPTLNQIEIMKQAKEMERQQIEDACNFFDFEELGEQYYNETFNK